MFIILVSHWDNGRHLFSRFDICSGFTLRDKIDSRKTSRVATGLSPEPYLPHENG